MEYTPTMLIPVLTGFVAVFSIQIFRSVTKSLKRFDELQEKLTLIGKDIKDFKREQDNRLSGIEQRLARMEGTMQERGYWESRLTGNYEKQENL